MRKFHIPLLSEIFEQIEKGILHMEDDEVMTYYFSEEDRTLRMTCIGTFSQLMFLYKAAKHEYQDKTKTSH